MPTALFMAGLLCEVAGIVFIYVFALAEDLERVSPIVSTAPPEGLMSPWERRGIACLVAGVVLQTVSCAAG